MFGWSGNSFRSWWKAGPDAWRRTGPGQAQRARKMTAFRRSSSVDDHHNADLSWNELIGFGCWNAPVCPIDLQRWPPVTAGGDGGCKPSAGTIDWHNTFSIRARRLSTIMQNRDAKSFRHLR